jgi:hypothetical protein
VGYQSFYSCYSLASIELPMVTILGSDCFYGCKLLGTVTLGGIGQPITDSSSYATTSFTNIVTTINIYVSDSGNPPTLTGIPWGATNATITYEQA